MSDEKRFTAALTNNKLTSEQLGELVEQAEAALTKAEAEAKTARDLALDPTRSPDAGKALAAMTAAEFARDRLRSLIPSLDHRYQQLSDQEQYDEWVALAERFLLQYNECVEGLREVYPVFVAVIAPLLQQTMIADAIAREIMNRKPCDLQQANGDGKVFPAIELAARNLSGASLGCSIVADLRLPAFAEDRKMAWPIDPNSPWFAELRAAVAAWFPHDPAKFEQQMAREQKLRDKFTRQQAAKAEAEAERRRVEQQQQAAAAIAASQQAEQDEAARNAARWGRYPWMS